MSPANCPPIALRTPPIPPSILLPRSPAPLTQSWQRGHDKSRIIEIPGDRNAQPSGRPPSMPKATSAIGDGHGFCLLPLSNPSQISPSFVLVWLRHNSIQGVTAVPASLRAGHTPHLTLDLPQHDTNDLTSRIRNLPPPHRPTDLPTTATRLQGQRELHR